MAESKKRKTNGRVVLKKGEQLRKDGRYMFRWTDGNRKRHTIYANTLAELRAREEGVMRDKLDGLRMNASLISLNDIYKRWVETKWGVRDNTFQNYKRTYRLHCYDAIGKQRLKFIKKSDVKRFYNALVEEAGLSESSVDNIHTVLHQVLQMAVDDEYIRNNPSENVMRELKRAMAFKREKRRALTQDEQKLFLDFLYESETYRHWYPVFAFMIGSGLRVGEVTGLRWCDVNLERGVIDVNHTLVYFPHENGRCMYNIHSTKTEAGTRTVVMVDLVKKALMMQQDYLGKNEMNCQVQIDGYTDFIFLNRYGAPLSQAALNKAIHRITRDCNNQILTENPDAELLLPHFTCHTLRHTFATRACEAGINVKVIQDTLGHADVNTTLNIYGYLQSTTSIGAMHRMGVGECRTCFTGFVYKPVPEIRNFR